MQADSVVTIAVGVIGVLSSIIAYGVGQGVTNEKIRRLEKDLDALNVTLKDAPERYVTFNHFDIVLEPMKNSLKDVQRDVKEILHAITSKTWPKN